VNIVLSRELPRGAHVRSTVFNPQTIQSSTRREKCEGFREYIYIYIVELLRERPLYKVKFQIHNQFLVKMSRLLKNPQGISILIVCIAYLCHMIWSVDAATDRYFFDRDIESRQLRLTYHDTSNICNNNEDIACLIKPQAFSFNSSDIIPTVYQVLEYEDYLNQREDILSQTSSNIDFTVFDSRTQTWYLVSKGDINPKPLEQASDELKDVQLSILYYTDVFSDIPSPNQAILWIAILTMIFIAATTFISFVSMIKYMCKPDKKNIYERSLNNRYLPWFLWMLSSLVFPITAMIELFKINKMDGCYIALISTMADWGSSGFIIWTIMRDGDIIPSKLEITRCITTHEGSEILQTKKNSDEHTRFDFCFLILELVLLLVPILAPVIIYAFNRTIFGPDDASQLTGYLYINTMMASINEIKIM
jgi:hypothetical protein